MALHPIDGPAGVEFDAALMAQVEDVVATTAMDVLDTVTSGWSSAYRTEPGVGTLRLGQDIARKARLELSRRLGIA